MSVIDLNQLPAPQVVEPLDFETILAERKAKLLEIFPDVADVLELESEPLNYLLQENAYRELVWRQRVNEAAKGVMLAFAVRGDLDQVAANLNTKRLEITPEDPSTTPPTPAVMENDESLRLRAQQSFETLTVAGPRSQYEAIAKAADGRVADASAISPAGAEVVVSVLSRLGNGTADQELLDIVEAALTPEDVRPLGDRLTVQSANIPEYSIEAILHVPSGPEAPPIVAAATAQLNAWLQQRVLGQSIHLTKLTSLLHVTGVSYVTLHSPLTDILLDRTQYAYCRNVTITVEVDGG